MKKYVLIADLVLKVLCKNKKFNDFIIYVETGNKFPTGDLPTNKQSKKENLK